MLQFQIETIFDHYKREIKKKLIFEKLKKIMLLL